MNKIYCMIYMSRQQRTCYIGIRRQELFSIQNGKISKIFIFYYYFFGYLTQNYLSGWTSIFGPLRERERERERSNYSFFESLINREATIRGLGVGN